MAQALTASAPQAAIPATIPTPRTAATAVSRLLSLDGWRAVSILMVLGSHDTFVNGFPDAAVPVFKLFFDGNLGVRFFFVISGFLITWLMLLERDSSGSVNLREFYIRRGLRILPIYCAYLCVLAALHATGVVKESASAWIGNLTFTRNMMGNVSGGDGISAHLWSLSVEEQFYLLWPALFFLLRKRQDRPVLAVLFIAILLALARRGIVYWSFSPGFLHSWIWDLCRPFLIIVSIKSFDCLALGCISAILFAHRREMIEQPLKQYPWAAMAAGVALIVIPHYSSALSQKPALAALADTVGPTLQALGFSILLLQSVLAPNWFCYRALNWDWVRRIGVLSYSIYIWQQLFWGSPQFLGLNRFWWMGLWIIPLFAVTMASYYGLERPLIKLRSRYREVKLSGM